MHKYELMVIFDPSTEDKQVTPILEKSLAVSPMLVEPLTI